MITHLIDASLRKPAIVLLATVAVVVGGLVAMRQIPLDAIPDLSDTQVIIRTDYPGQAPQIVEDQVTYPLTTAMLAVPGAETVRGYSMVGSSFVYVIFADGTDLYWARSRVLEQLSTVTGRLPAGVSPQLGPDATGVGWIYQYALVTGPYSPDHPEGLWHDPEADRWYVSADEAPEKVREQLIHHRTFKRGWSHWVDPRDKTVYASPEAAPAALRPHLVEIEIQPGIDRDPLTGTPLVAPDVDLAELRSLQDWYLRYELTAVDGVSEVAAVGGMVRQYQVVVDPVAMEAYGLDLQRIRKAVARSNLDIGARLIELGETEFLVRSLGYLGSRRGGPEQGRERATAVLDDLSAIALATGPAGAPVRLGDVAEVRLGPEIRRGIAELDGRGEVAGAIVVMRSGENARDTIHAVRERLAALERSLPPGVEIVTTYDRSDLIDRAIETLVDTLSEEILVVSLVTLAFLLHARSALVAVVVLPTGVLASLLSMWWLGLGANIMSLGGIAIAIGVMVDSSVIMVDNAHEHLERERRRVAAGERPRSRFAVIREAAMEVGPSLFFSLVIITVSFLPVFALGQQDGRLFHPLAWTKTLSMAAAALLAVTLIPVLILALVNQSVWPQAWSRRRSWLTTALVLLLPAALLTLAPLPRLEEWRSMLVLGWLVVAGLVVIPQRLFDESVNPVSRLLIACYDPVFALAMRFRLAVVGLAALVCVGTFVYVYPRLGSEFMPPLEEGDFLYMPNADPGLSVTKAREILQQTDRLIARFPEVTRVFGKIGRADTATDPAPLTMIETTILLERDRSKWRQVPETGWARLWRTTRPITIEELTDGYELPGGRRVPGINDVLRIPGLTGALTRGAMPIRTRIDMLATGIRTRIGIKVLGDDLEELARIGDEVVQVLKTDPRTAPDTKSANADRSFGGRYIDIRIDRAAIGRHAMAVAEVQETVAAALGGATATYTIEGRERYPVNLRFPAEVRDTPEKLGQVLVRGGHGDLVPLAQLADIRIVDGPPMVKSENARPTAWIYVEPKGDDLVGYVEAARRALDERVDLPAGYSLVWSGQYQYIQARNARLALAVPAVLLVIVVLLYLATGSWLRTAVVCLALPFSLVGSLWFLYFLDYQISTAVWVGVIALAGLDAETGLVMLLYLDNSCQRARDEGRLDTRDQLWWAIHEGAVKRIRPKTMTVFTTFIGLLPLMWADGAGADTMRRLAAPMLGGLVTSFILELVVYPAIWYQVTATRLGSAGKDETASATVS